MKRVNIALYTHVEVCKQSLIDDNVYNNFKQYPAFTKILEHTSEANGHKFANQIGTTYKEYAKKLDWNKLIENDTVGSPHVIPFYELREHLNLEFFYFSPSTIHYIYTGLDIIHTVLKDRKEINILEIGGGYGGQCKILHDMCDMLGVKINRYGIVDLEYVSKLQNKYLSSLGHQNIEYYEYENIEDIDVFKEYDVLISVYGLGEFELDVQNYYVDIIVKHMKDYYIIWNTQEINNFFKNDKIVDETPQTGRFCKIITKGG